MATAREVTLSAQAWELARLRDGSHAPGAGRDMSGNGSLYNNALGAEGELLVARAFGLRVDWDARPDGDPGWDFEVCIRGRRIRIDVKTTDAFDPHLLIATADIRKDVDIYVLVQIYKGEGRILGWETRGVMACMDCKPFKENGPLSYYRHMRYLRPMGEFADLMAARD